MRRALIIAVSVLVLSIACGGSDSPSAPNVPSYAGNWSGRYSFTGCTQTGGIALADICGQLGSTGSGAFTMTLTQSGNTAGATVGGSFTLGSLVFPITTPGTVAASGGVTFSGTNISGSTTVVTTFSLSAPLAGTLSQLWTSSGLSGSASVNGSIASANKTSTALPPQRLDSSSLHGLVEGLKD